MKAIIIEHAAFEHLFEEFRKDLEIGEAEAVDAAHPEERRDAKFAVAAAKRKWTYAFRTLQANLEKSR